MIARMLIAALTLVCIASCGRPSSSSGDADNSTPQLEAPAPEGLPTRVFAPTNDAARGATGSLNVSISLRLPDVGTNADPREVLALRGENGFSLEAQISGAVSPATMVDGQTLRALLDLAVEEPQVLVYRVSQETKSASGRGLCAAGAPDFVVVWEPTGPGDPVMKLMGVAGGAPGAADARSCPMLAYRRS